ncbi:MAG: hypothetical protein HY755_05425 [Nitrospirae bacterium]|nr:hypothetical protein [Nitrospirota bacterium]
MKLLIPVLALPGWLVNRVTSEQNILVINSKEAIKAIAHKEVVFDEQTI